MSKKYLKITSLLLAATALSVPMGCVNDGDKTSQAIEVAASHLTVTETDTGVDVSGENFSAHFSKETGSLENLVYGGKTIITDGPKLNAFRAVINNDEWVYSKWFQSGLFDLAHETEGDPVVSQNADGTVSLAFIVKSRGKHAGELKGDPLIQYGRPLSGIPKEINIKGELGENDLTFIAREVWTVYPDGSIELESSITSNDSVFDLPRLGFVLGVPSEFGNFSYYGRGPQENYKDRRSGAFVGIYESPVAEQIAEYAKPQETGNHEDVRWCALTNADGEGVIFVAGTGTFSAGALPVTAMDLLMASNPYKLNGKIENSETTIVTLDAGVRGLGGASCGPDTEKRDKVFAAPTDFAFIIRPVTKGEDLSELANVSTSGVAPISVSRDPIGGEVSISSLRSGAEILYSVNGGPTQTFSEKFPFRNGGEICAWFKDTPKIKTDVSFKKLDKIRTTVIFASSENSGDVAATNLTDGDPDTIWHTAYFVTQADYPHWVDFDIGETKTIRGVSYLPRQTGGKNGDIKDFEIYVSNDPQNWGEPVVKGQFENTKQEQQIIFAEPVEGRYVRFRALSSQNGHIFAAGAEFGVLAD